MQIIIITRNLVATQIKAITDHIVFIIDIHAKENNHKA